MDDIAVLLDSITEWSRLADIADVEDVRRACLRNRNRLLSRLEQRRADHHAHILAV